MCVLGEGGTQLEEVLQLRRQMNFLDNERKSHFATY